MFAHLFIYLFIYLVLKKEKKNLEEYFTFNLGYGKQPTCGMVKDVGVIATLVSKE